MADKKKRKPSKLKQFARQYKHRYLGDYLYIECPRPMFNIFKEARWLPEDEDMALVKEKILNRGKFVDYAYFYDKKDRCYYVIDHLWLSTLASWGNKEMQDYLRIAFARMLSKVWEKPVVVQVQGDDEKFATVVDVVDDEGKSVLKKDNTATAKTAKPLPKQLSLIKDEVIEEEFLIKYGIARSVYENMIEDSYVLTTKSGSLHILEICKFLYKEESLKMSTIYAKLKELDIISQPPVDMEGQFQVYLSKVWKDDDRGFNLDRKGTTYPVFKSKGIIMLGMILHDHGLTSKYLLPAL